MMGKWFGVASFLIMSSLLFADGRIVLKEEASVSTKYIKLTDLMDSPIASGILDSIYLGKSPEGETVRVITADEILSEIKRRDGRGDYTIVGDSVKVTSFDSVNGREFIKVAIANKIKEHFLSNNKNYHRDSIKVNVIYMSPECDGGSFEVQSIVHKDSVTIGTSGYVVKYTANGNEATADVIANVQEMKRVAVAAKPIYPGKVLTSADIILKNLTVEDGDTDYFTDASILIGSVSLFSIGNGECIRPDMLRLKPVVRNRDVVRARGKFVEADAVALQDGAIGEVIRLEYKATKSKFRGKVISGSLVSVVNEGER